MADPRDVSQYKYSAMSNLVLKVDRRLINRPTDKATGEPESIAGRLTIKDMGSRVAPDSAPKPKKPTALPDVERGSIQEGRDVLLREQRKRKADSQLRGTGILGAADLAIEGIQYRPRTAATRATFDLILTLVASSLGDVPYEVVRSAADAVLEYLKDEDMKDFDKKKEDDDEDDKASQGSATLDDRQGVAVAFEDEDEEDDIVPEVRDYSSEDDEAESDEDDATKEADGAEAEALQVGDEMILDSADGARDAKEDGMSVPAREVDAFWLQRQVGKIYPDPKEQHDKTQDALGILSGEPDEPGGEEKPLREIENDLMELFEYEHHELVQLLIENREKVVWLTKLARAENSDDRAAVEREMASEGLQWILNELYGKKPDDDKKKKVDIKMDLDAPGSSANGAGKPEKPDGQLGNHLMTNPKVRLPEGSTKRTFKGYEEIHVPAPKKRSDPNDPLIPITEMPEWARVPFSTAKSLNRIQSKCYPTAFQDDGNMLICAPTGSGKTNVAMLTILREVGKHRNPETGTIDLDSFKIVYIAPLKALVQEQVGNFGKRLQPYGITVSELTGDRQLTKQQIAETQIIVTTPKNEIHLLHDDRGPVLESIVSRTIRKTEQTGDPVRLVGLSATLPNFRDVASFLRVDMKTGLFHFDGSFRPCPLRQEFIGVTDRKAIKQLKTMNDVTYNKVLEHVGTNRNQMLIFVHSRKDTAKTARYIRDKALEMDTINQILRHDAGSRAILNEASEQATDKDLKDILPYGFGIHHAGMNRADRADVEDLFAQGSIQVLVCTATLAWGVNLPAHTVIIKGTQVYSPEKGSWVELNPQDVLQMLGRAGRPQFDTYGEGIIITTQSEMTYYLSLLNQQLPIESQFVSRLVDNLNAEIVLGNIRTRDEGVEWLGYTYLFVRMLRSPGLYQVGAEYEDDSALEQKRVDLIHSAATVLRKSGLVKYDEKTGKLQATELGRIASHYYITHGSMDTYNTLILPGITTIELFRVFSLSAEFKYIPVRQDEKVELAKLLSRVPIPVKESIEESHAKINVLLQAYISRLRLDGFALMADMVYVTQSAGRILRAIFEITLKKGWSDVAKTALDLCKMAEKRMWPTMTPLRQFPNCPRDIVQKAERVEAPWSAYFDLDPPRMGELLGMPRHGRTVCGLVAKFPRLDVQALAKPLTRSMLHVTLEITPNFEWDDEVHGAAESFWIMVEDCDGEKTLYHDQFILRKEYAKAEDNRHVVDFTVEILDPLPPHYFRSSPHTELLKLQPLPVSALKVEQYVKLYPDWQHFNSIQTQTFNSLYSTDDNVLVAAPTGSGKTVCAEFALLRHWAKSSAGKALYIAPNQELVDIRLRDWEKRLSHLRGGKLVVKLSGETATDLDLLNRGDLIIATPSQWDVLSRQWRRRKNVQLIELLIADELHLLGDNLGYIYEVVVSRMQYISGQTERPLRTVALGVSLANAKDIGSWIGAKKHDVYNFSPLVRPLRLELHLQSFSIPHFPSLMLAMAKPTYLAITQMSPNLPALVFVHSRKQTRATARDLLAACYIDDDEDRFLHAEGDQLKRVLDHIDEEPLREALSHGIGYYHEALSQSDRRILDCTAHLVIVMGTQYFDGQEHRYLDYSMSEVLHMFGKALISSDKRSRGVLMVPAVKREFYSKFLREALPVESHVAENLHDTFVTEISTKMIQSAGDAVNWTTFTYFYRRLLANPSYYGLTELTDDALGRFISDRVEDTFGQLNEAKIIEYDDEDGSVVPLNAAMIAAYYNISYVTMETFLLSLTGRTKLKGIMEVVTSATEFEAIQLRRHEGGILRRVYEKLPVKMSGEVNFDSAHFKAFVLLQAHFSRLQLPVDLNKDQEVILSKVLGLLSAAVDILSSEGHLNAMNAMEMSQMVVQSMWDRDSPLKQIPHFTDDTIRAANKFGIKDVFDFMERMNPEENDNYDALVKALGLSNNQLSQVADFTNTKYPDIEMEHTIEDEDEIRSNEPAYLNITIQRNVDEDDEVDPTVHAPFYPAKKMENWWLVVGDENTKSLLAIKRVTILRKLEVKLEFTVSTAGKHDLKLYLMSDSYMGVDQEQEFAITAAEGMDVDDDDDEDDEDDE
ncbi:unnamed protein product [Parascedosporium putredinis]|uniref:U5 small nuclear ribonucleoprotein 200 kDa helicase n=2 Tax=Parascedosporium putredinis TaxID=1442378 RepID=A0A9P1H6K2_9PEZI|nr:unnamed protein product [Parascedosporium putredinis]CAI7998083.1 unnamed protein product [Parascedosporium putredinis]